MHRRPTGRQSTVVSFWSSHPKRIWATARALVSSVLVGDSGAGGASGQGRKGARYEGSRERDWISASSRPGWRG